MNIEHLPTRKQNTWHLIRYAYHEAGHAVVGHVIGRYIAEISIVSDRERGYRGYCAFDAFAEDVHGRSQWQKDSKNRELLTILYAGTIAMAMICQWRGWKYKHWKGCDKADLEYIDQLSLEMFESNEQRRTVQEECQQQENCPGPMWNRLRLASSS